MKHFCMESLQAQSHYKEKAHLVAFYNGTEFCHKPKCSNPYIFATCRNKPLIFQT